MRGARLPTALLLALYLGSRLPALTLLPIFLDETTHIRWSVFIAQGEKLWRPWNYGKGLSVWLNALLFPWAMKEYLWASRALVVAFGVLSLLGAVAIARRLFDLRTGLLAGVFYIVCPFAFFYDRLALTDAPMAAFGTLTLLASVQLAREPTLARGLLVALTLVLTVLTKAAGMMLLAVPVLSVALLAQRRGKAWAALAGGLLGAALVLAYPLLRFQATTSTVRLGVEHHGGDLGARLLANLEVSGEWLLVYFTAPLVVLGVLAVGFAIKEQSRPVLLLAVLAALPVLAFSAVASLWFPRYLVVVIVPGVVLAARGFARLTASWPSGLSIAAMLLAIVPGLRVHHDLRTDPTRAALPDTDLGQFVFDWPSGYGTVGTLAFAREELRQHPEGITIVAHSPSRRTSWLALGLEFADEPRVDLRDLDVSTRGALDLLAAWARTKPTLLLVSPVGPAKTPPEPLSWAHLGARRLRSCKPDGGLCDLVYRLDYEPPQMQPP